MENDKRQRIEVAPEDAGLLARIRENERRAEERTKKETEAAAEKAGRPVKAGMTFYDEDEVKYVALREELEREYQAKLGLPQPPILVPPSQPPMPPAGMHSGGLGPPGNKRPGPLGGQFPPQSGAFHVFERQKEGPLIPEELKDRFLQAVPTYRVGDRLYLWDSGRYCYFSDNEAKARIKTILRSKIYITNPTTVLNSVLALLKAEENIIGEPDNYPHLVAVQNGELDLNTLTLHPATPAHFLTHYLDVWWGGPQPCPVFMAFLDRTTGGDPELRQRLLEAIGYLLVPDYRPKKFVVFQGAGDCGKSVLGNLIASFFERGDSAALADHQFGERFALSFIANARFCLCMDLFGGTIDAKAVSVLKQVTGGDMVSIEAKGKDAYSDYIHCKVLFGTNHPIQLKCRDQAFAKRLMLVPFLYPVPPEQQDRDLLTKLMAERAGILYLALNAYRDVVKRGYQFTGEGRFGFTVQQIVVEEPPPDSVALFYNKCCIPATEEIFTPTEVLHEAFKSFCVASGLPTIYDRAAFSRALRGHLGGQIIPDKRRVNGIPTNGYKGIMLREEGSSNV